RPLARPAREGRQRLRDGCGRVTDGEAHASLTEVDAQDAAHSNQSGEGLLDGPPFERRGVDRVDRGGPAENEAAAQVAARTALDLEHADRYAGRAAEDVGEDPGGEEAARPVRGRRGVRLDPVRALEAAHARVQVLVVEAAPATGGEEVGQAAPEDRAGKLAECRGIGVLARGVLAAAEPAGEGRAEGVAGGEAGLLEHSGGRVRAQLIVERSAQRGEGGYGEIQLRESRRDAGH